jgi:hypothetical protein
MLIFATAKAFAGVGDAVVSNEFPSDKLMLENHVYQNAAVFENLGVYSGTVYAIAQYTDAPTECDPGYYLPENTTECVICDENYYCVGGVNAIKEPCADNMVSPSGAAGAGYCGKKMHVGEDTIYLTTEKHAPMSLAVQMGNKTYYANMAPVANGVKYMHTGTTRSLKMLYNNVEYYIYDNTVQ